MLTGRRGARAFLLPAVALVVLSLLLHVVLPDRPGPADPEAENRGGPVESEAGGSAPGSPTERPEKPEKAKKAKKTDGEEGQEGDPLDLPVAPPPR